MSSELVKNPLHENISIPVKTPQRLLAEMNKKYPGVWKFVDEKRLKKKNLKKDSDPFLERILNESWPDWCFAPHSIWINFLIENPLNEKLEMIGGIMAPNRVDKLFNGQTIYKLVNDYFYLSQEEKEEKRKIGIPFELLQDLITDDSSALMALGAWRPTQSICRFEKTLGRSLIEASFSGKIPSSVFLRLPEWGIYIDTLDFDLVRNESKVNGFFVSLDRGYNNNQGTINFYYNLSNGQVETVSLALNDFSLEESIDIFNKNVDKCFDEYNLPTERDENGKTLKDRKKILGNEKKLLFSSLSLTLYLCSKEPDIVNHQDEKLWQKNNPEPQKVKGGYRIFPPDRPVEWIIGEKLEQQVRLFENKKERGKLGGTHASPRPHVRKSHWHHYWKGSKKEGQDLFPVFLSPISVNLFDRDLPGEKEAIAAVRKKM